MIQQNLADGTQQLLVITQITVFKQGNKITKISMDKITTHGQLFKILF